MRQRCTRALVICLLGVLAAPSFAQQVDVVGGIAAENANFTAQLREDETALDHARVELEDLRKAKHELEERMQWVERRADVYTFGQEFAYTLNERLRQLPRPERFAASSEQRARLLSEASDADIRVERALGGLRDLDTAVLQRLAAPHPPIPQEQKTLSEHAVRSALAEQRDLLEQLSTVERTRVDMLHETEEAWRDLEQLTQEARAKLTRLLFWMPGPPSTRTVGAFGPALAWLASPTNWSGVGEVMRLELARRPFWPVLALVAATTLLALRGRLLRALVSLSPIAMTYERYRIGHALAAVAITFALALPVPILSWTGGAMLGHASDDQLFALALSDALWAMSKLLLAILALAWLFDRRGVAIRHFGWDELTLSGAARALRRFAAVFVPLSFVAALNGLEHAPFPNRESIARLAFSLAMLTLVGFLVRLFRAGGPMMQRLRTRAPRSRYVQLHAYWFGALLILPLAIAGLAATGYFVAAGYFYGRIVESVFLAIGAVLLYGLMALWVQVQRLHLAHRRGDATARPKEDPAGDPGSEVAEARPAHLDIAMIGEQTRALLDMLVTVLLLAGLWLVWRDSLPALAAILDYSLWSYPDVLDGKQVTRKLTAGYLFLAIVVGVVTVVVVRNLGALLDIILLQRLEMQTDATYAIKVIARYAVSLIGLVFAFNLLGIHWNDVQWLVAALGVGLGFGLQEIVGNFVSGLIVLAERPIRIGDVVTVCNVSGTVSRIHARATVVIDFDNKEVIIPNKAFITERVVNWTLSDQTIRLLIKVGIAYGSDVALVQRVMLAALHANRDVLTDPAPSVFFVAFGDSTLDFEIRAFVNSLDKRLRVQHEINSDVARVLRENGIEIPFPQRDLHIRSAPGPVGAGRSFDESRGR